MRYAFVFVGLSMLGFGQAHAGPTIDGPPPGPAGLCLFASDTSTSPTATWDYGVGGPAALNSDEDNYPNCGFIAEYTNVPAFRRWTIEVPNSKQLSQEACLSSWISARVYALHSSKGQWVTLERKTVSGYLAAPNDCRIRVSGVSPDWATTIRLVGDANHLEAQYPYLPPQAVAVATRVGF
ncbi:MAG: hypothetical protein AAFX94_01665 [Myxococcota bacterium]